MYDYSAPLPVRFDPENHALDYDRASRLFCPPKMREAVRSSVRGLALTCRGEQADFEKRLIAAEQMAKPGAEIATNDKAAARLAVAMRAQNDAFLGGLRSGVLRAFGRNGRSEERFTWIRQDAWGKAAPAGWHRIYVVDTFGVDFWDAAVAFTSADIAEEIERLERLGAMIGGGGLSWENDRALYRQHKAAGFQLAEKVAEGVLLTADAVDLRPDPWTNERPWKALLDHWLRLPHPLHTPAAETAPKTNKGGRPVTINDRPAVRAGTRFLAGQPDLSKRGLAAALERVIARAMQDAGSDPGQTWLSEQAKSLLAEEKLDRARKGR